MSNRAKKKFESTYPSIEKFIIRKKNTFIEKKIEKQLKNAVLTADAKSYNVVDKIDGSCAIATATSTADSEAFETDKTADSEAHMATAECDKKKELMALKNKYKICEQNLKLAKNLLRKSSQLNLDKDLKIQQIISQQEKSIPISCSGGVLFKKYSDRFDADDLIEIRSVGPGLKKDSKFITKIVYSFYKNEIEKLHHRTATGKKFNGKKKHEITIEKKRIMECMLIERVKAELKDQMEASSVFLNRVARLNLLLRFAIGNLRPKKKSDFQQNVTFYSFC